MRPLTVPLCLVLTLAVAAGAAPAPAAGPLRGGTLVVGLKAEPDSFNVYLARTVESLWLANRTQPRLWREVVADDARTAAFEPELATGPPLVDAAGTSLTITLRDDARWADGTPITCDDLAATLAAQVDPAVAWRDAAVKRHILRVECPGPRTAVYRFDRAVPTATMDVNDSHVLPRSLAGATPRTGWRTRDWAAALPAGGPFRLARRAAGQEVVLERNTAWRWPADAARLDRIVLRVVPDASSRLTQLLAGDLDVVPGLTPADAARAARDRGVSVVKRRGLAYTYLGWNTVDPADHARPHPLFGDARVRRALTLAIDREGLIDALLLGEAEVPPSPILDPLPAHDPQLAPWPHDPAAARRLLAEAGFADHDGDGTLDRDGRRFAFELAVAAGNRVRRDAAALIQRDLAAVGIALTIRPVEDGSFYRTLAGGVDAWMAQWRVPSRVDMTELLHKNACGASGSNFGCWSDPAADAIATAARDAASAAEADAGWRRWERIFHDQQPYTILFRARELTGVRTRVHGAESLLANDPLHGCESWWVAPTDGK